MQVPTQLGNIRTSLVWKVFDIVSESLHIQSQLKENNLSHIATKWEGLSFGESWNCIGFSDESCPLPMLTFAPQFFNWCINWSSLVHNLLNAKRFYHCSNSLTTDSEMEQANITSWYITFCIGFSLSVWVRFDFVKDTQIRAHIRACVCAWSRAYPGGRAWARVRVPVRGMCLHLSPAEKKFCGNVVRCGK